ncbi:GNAT family N-acetyltransferase [Acinetobacter seifertii]|uniref:GNAT family N-acetyltransferase n=1 Tax=Acinetobacter seifertii TaxID=1530123 RepID=UPI000A302F75|nr:GNAT family protein [Acinetobacter seifertii]OUC66966.1 GCN5-related N-acetyltransferase [Acinetobacter seifertii]QNX32640.1 GNAT family N-acetyltransferase [Acinetobacter seifertii]
MPLNITLSSHRIRLRILTIEDSRDLVTAASDGELWNLPFTVVPSAETVDDYIQHALEGYQAGTVLPFVVVDIATGKIIGSTRFWKIDRKNLKLEIGSTWYSKSWQRTYANTEAKYLMLQYAFEELNCVRVQFTTDVLNEKSQNAILRIGAQKEGVVRNERIMPNGRKRNSVRFSIIDEEWPSIKDNLIKKLNYY